MPEIPGAEFHRIPMRDGKLLATRVWRPTSGGAFPVVLERGYAAGKAEHVEPLTSAGYVYVGQQARGNLEGGMFRTDNVDGYDCLDWIVAQPWCNGQIAMYGRSFQGAVQLRVAPERHPNLRAIVPQVINPQMWERGYWDHGALQLSHTARRIYRTEIAPEEVDKVMAFGGWDAFYRHLPLITLDQAVIGKKNNLWQEYVTHSQYDDYWAEISTADKLDRINIPVYIHAGWYDNYPAAMLKMYQQLHDTGSIKELRIHVGPTDHGGQVVGDRPFGDDAHHSLLDLAIRWLDWVVKGINNGVEQEPPITIYTMGVNEWRGLGDWPPKAAVPTRFFFHSDGARHGRLDTTAPSSEPPSSYVYDPDDPVPTLGGNHSGPQDHPEIIRVGAIDQRANWNRPDVLVFESAPLPEATEVTGPISAVVHAATSVPDTDFLVRLIDRYPDGTAYNLTEGIVRARFRESLFEPPKLLEPGKIYRYGIELQPTSNVFLPGHRICVHVTSSSFPLYDRNPNTGHAQGMDAERQSARQTIYHDAQHPSTSSCPSFRRRIRPAIAPRAGAEPSAGAGVAPRSSAFMVGSKAAMLSLVPSRSGTPANIA